MKNGVISSITRSACVLVTVTLLFSLLCGASCTQKTSELIYDDKQSLSFSKEMWLDAYSLFCVLHGETSDVSSSGDSSDVSNVSLNKSADIAIDDVSKSGDSYLFLWHDEDESYISAIDHEGNSEYCVRVSIGCTGNPIKVFTDSDGSMLIILEEENSLDWSYQYSCIRVDKTGEIMQSQTLLPFPENFHALSWDMDSNNNLYILGDKSIVALSDSLAFRYEMSLKDDTFPSSLAVTNMDDLYIALFDKNNQIELDRINKDSGEIDQTIPTQGLNGSDIILYGANSGISNGLIVDTGDKLVKFDPLTNSMKMYLSYGLEGISKVDDTPLLFASDNSILILASQVPLGTEVQDNQSTEQYTGLMRIVGSEFSVDRTILTIGVLSTDEATMLMQNVHLFNNSQTTFQIEIKDYVDTSAITDAESYLNALAEGKKRMKADIMSESTPDIICLGKNDLSDYENQDILVDLNVMISGDSSFDESDYLPNIWNALESDGARYTIAPFFSVRGIIGSDKVLGDITAWTTEEFEAVLDREKDWQHVFYDDSCQNMFRRLYPAIADFFIDYNTGEAEFRFAKLLEYLSVIEKYSNEIQDPDHSVMEQTKSGTTLFLDANIFTFENYPNLMEYYDGKIAEVGYPGALTSGPLITSEEFYGISAKSLEQEGAWTFLCFLLSDSVQNNSDPAATKGIPVQIKAFENMITWGSIRYEDGNNITIGFQTKAEQDAVSQEIADVISGAGDSSPSVNKTSERVQITPEVIQDFRDLIGSASAYQSVDEEIYGIISEEMEYYFNGSKTMEEVAALIQNRLEVYMDEKS